MKNWDCSCPLVSILTPAYNSSKYILDTIRSAKEQTYSNWEMLIVDDASSDDTYALAASVVDSRIKITQSDKNLGAAGARNLALNQASGRFIAYLDADDIWMPDKLEKQVRFMLDGGIGFSCVSYEIIDGAGNPLGKKVYTKEKLDYRGCLLNNRISTLSVMVDLQIVEKPLLQMPLGLKIGEDLVTWLQILKKGHFCYGMPQILAKYRRATGSTSSNKIKAAKSAWHIYKNVEQLPFYFACYCFIKYALWAVWKRMYW